jgi:hypothetical protein
MLTPEKQFNKYNSKQITANGNAYMSQHEMWNNTMTRKKVQQMETTLLKTDIPLFCNNKINMYKYSKQVNIVN